MNKPAGPQDAVSTREVSSTTAAETMTTPPAPTLVAPSGDACPACGSPMAADQRYCIECGERRGDSRLSNLEEAVVTQPHATPTPAVTSYAPPSAPRGRSQGLALIATIGLLLLSMGVGVLIGNKGGNSTSGVAQQPIVLGAASPTVATGATSATTASSSKDAEAEAAAAAGDSGGADADAVAKKNGVKLAPKDAKVGDKCESGAVGCDGGKFTGDYFGGD